MTAEATFTGILGLILRIVLLLISLKSKDMNTIVKMILVSSSAFLIIIGCLTLWEIYVIVKELYHL
ncbi:hypothetical protein ACO11K_000120 [Bacillus cytotoxicus]|uniref:hypothetical protein n=1 Tax=Bacillus cereus group sp. BfR-BA-01492 TaxID=2920361 RepID=UPI001F586DFF|nr:hypothetical protein [Bacillus cereus group sp. BfR-BA-01492]EMA6341882.1 hypothetical protein [Bacillus cytotoxicus]